MKRSRILALHAPDLGAVQLATHQSQATTFQYKRANGPYALYMVAGANNKLPYGSIPRLLMVWMCSEATQKQSPELFLGDSLSEFLGKVGIPKGGGRSNPAPRADGPLLQCLCLADL